MRERGLILHIPPTEHESASLSAGQRQSPKARGLLSKQDEGHMAAMEVARHKALIDTLTNLHKECGEEVDWEQMRLEGAPAKPKLKYDRQAAAMAVLQDYYPSILEKLFGQAKLKRQELVNRVNKARLEDAAANKELMDAYKKTYAEWKSRKEVATKVLAGSAQAYYDALKLANPFGRIVGLGRSIQFSAEDGRPVRAVVSVYSEEDLPREIKILSKSERVSTREMPPIMLRGLHATHVCSSVLRVARETFALLPVDVVIVTAMAMVLNTKTGHSNNTPILSAAIRRREIRSLNFLTLDPVDAMANFTLRMNFKKVKGFEPIEPLEPSDLG